MSRLFPLAGATPRDIAVARWFTEPDSELRQLARGWFDEWRLCGDDVEELLHDGHPTVCVRGVALGYVDAFQEHVNVGFFLGATLPDPAGLLEGTGRHMRHVKVRPVPPIDQSALRALIRAAYHDLKARLPDLVRDPRVEAPPCGVVPPTMPYEHDTWMRLAIDEAERARGGTGDNPWVGCVIVGPQGELLGRGHTQGPGEDHAEIDAARDAHARGRSVVGATLYSTLEPCAFHGRTPACARSIAERGITRVVIGMRDPHPRVNGAGTRILRDAGVEVVEGVCEADVRRQLGPWVLTQHPHEPRLRAQGVAGDERIATLAAMYGVDAGWMASVLSRPSEP